MSSRDHNNVTTVSFSTQAASVYSGRLSSFQHVSYSSDNAMSQTVPSQLRAAIGNNVSLWAGHYGSLWVTMGHYGWHIRSFSVQRYQSQDDDDTYFLASSSSDEHIIDEVSA